MLYSYSRAHVVVVLTVPLISLLEVTCRPVAPQAVLGLAVEEGTSLGEVTANESTVAQVLECFLSNSNCSLFRSVLAPPLASQLGEGEAGRVEAA